MTNPPKQPRAIGQQFEYARRTAKHTRQRMAAGTDGSVTTRGYIPNKPKRQILPAAKSDGDVWL